MEDSDSLGDLELGSENIKLSFDELRQQLLKEPTRITKSPALCRALFHYCKDSKKHGRIIRFLFWPIIMSLVQNSRNYKISLFGLRAFNQLLTYEGSLAAVIQAGKASKLHNRNNNIAKIIRYFDAQQTKENADGAAADGEDEKDKRKDKNVKMLNDFIARRQNPILILVSKLRESTSFQIMQECSKAIRNLAQSPEVIKTLQEEGDLILIIKEKFLDADPFTQENILETVSFACKFPEYRKSFADDPQVIDILLSQVQSISLKVTYFTIKICRRLSKDKQSIMKLQGDNLRLTEKLIVAFRWLDRKREADKRADHEKNELEASAKKQGQEQQSEGNKDGTGPAGDEAQANNDIYSLVFCEISKSFQYILKYYETHKVLLDKAQQQEKGKNLSIETDIIETIVQLGKQTKDPLTQLNAATCLAHITEVLHCNPEVAHRGIEFMIDMLKDAKNLKHYRQGCRYFANLSFYKDFRDELIDKDIGQFLLKAIDGQPDSDTIKHSAIALANLSSHKGFMGPTQRRRPGTTGESAQSSKAEKWKIKPLIHLLDSAQEHKINLIQSACITLCNMASKPQLHQHFIHEPEISTIKNCLSNPIDKEKGNELVRFMIKLVCNLTKNPEMLGHLSRKGFLEDLFVLLDHEREKEIFGNVVTAISYLSVQKDCQEKIIKNKIIPRILEPLTQIPEVDQKMIIIALTSMLFNGIDVQREFIKHGGLGKLLFFMQQKDKIFQQLACKCFSLLSENQQNLQEILDQECLNTIIISCLRTKDIDLETLKEITKIFINLILWRKISKNTFETTCCLCDIGLMIDDQDMNILAIFCLNALSENEESHAYIRNSGVSFSIHTLDHRSTTPAGKVFKEDEPGHQINTGTGLVSQDSLGASNNQQAVSTNGGYNGQSLFNRINFLLEYHEQKREGPPEQTDKQALIVTLITSFYLNLARNEENIPFLLQLKLFKRLNLLMQSLLRSNNHDSTALCYTNTIFSKLLKSPQSLEHCVEEEGYELFIGILKGQQPNRHLFLETLDSIKLFLSKREYLSRFKDIPDYVTLDDDYPDLVVSFLQVLAILSFEKENHERLKSPAFLAKLSGAGDGKERGAKDSAKGGIFGRILTQFDQLVEQKSKEKKKQHGGQQRSVSPRQSARFGGNNDKRDKSQENASASGLDGPGGGAAGGNHNRATVRGRGKAINRRNRIRESQDQNRAEELALAVSIILANLSCDRDFLRILLGVDGWSVAEKKPRPGEDPQPQLPSEDGPVGGMHDKDDLEGADEDDADNNDTLAVFEKKMNAQKSELMNGNMQFRTSAQKEQALGCYGNYDDEILRGLPQVQRITRLFNLLSHDNIYISEQIAILLANVSNSPYFRHIFVTDRCMKSLLKILRDQNYDQVARVSQLAALIVVLNLTSMNDIIVGLENMRFMQTLQEIIRDERLPNVNKSIALLAISNIQTFGKRVMTQINPETKDFAFQVLLNWKMILDEEGESVEVVKNLVYASLILFYNLILKKVGTASTINQLINVITDRVLAFEDDQIINVVLELITLFTRKKETSDYILQKQPILQYVFDKLRSRTNNNQETLRLAALALSRLAARLDDSNGALFIENLTKIKFEDVVDKINQQRDQSIMQTGASLATRSPDRTAEGSSLANLGQQSLNRMGSRQGTVPGSDEATNGQKPAEASQGQRNAQLDCTLRYFLNFLENITSFKRIREVLSCPQLYQTMLQLYSDDIIVYSKISLISILFNLNFNLQQPPELDKVFLKRLYHTYKEELAQDEKTRRKIITIVVSASAHEPNHKAIIKSNFYTQFKRNINDQYAQLVEADEEVELFGLVNIVLNQSYMHLIYQDLKKIHKIALKNSKIAFKTKVDLFLECSKFLARISQSEDDEQVAPVQGGISTTTAMQRRASLSGEAGDTDANGRRMQGLQQTLELEKDKSEMIDCCLKALLFSLIKIIGLLDTSNFSMFKYFLIAILDCSQNLRNHIIYLIKIENLIEFLKRVLKQDFKFNLSEFDDQVLNFSLRIIVCEIFFNLKQEKYFFKLDNISEAIQLLIKFAQSVIYKNIEKKMFLVSNTLRLMSQMITQIHNMPEAQSPELQRQQIEFVKGALTLSKDLQPCINIDALFCLTNMMNIKELACHEALIKDNETVVNNALVIYFAYNHQVELDECIITFLYAISKYENHQEFMKDKSKVLYLLMDRQLNRESEATTDTSRQKIFSLFHNMTENEAICSQLNAKQFIMLTNKMLQQTNINKYSADHIHELALKSIINLCKSSQETFEEADLKEFLANICKMYPKFKNLSKQYALRLITILTKQWQVNKIQEFLREITDILSQFIENCESVIELKLVIMNLEKIASCKHLMKSLADLSDSCKLLIKNIHHLIARSVQKKDYHSSIEQLFRFCKKISKQHKAQEYLVNEAIHEICLRYITENLNISKTKMDETVLKQTLTTIQNIMKMIKNIFDGNITREQQHEIYQQVTAKEEIITESDQLLSNYKDSDSKDELDELAIIIVNIIICYNSISKKLDIERVKAWIQTFSERLITASQRDFNKEEQARSWYMEKYVLIIELLVTKNLDKIDKDMTYQLLKIYQIRETQYFTNTIWYKLMKILAHLQNIQDITHKNYIECIMQFILQAYEKAKENLCFFYFMKIVLLIFKKSNNNELLQSYPQYSHILATCINFLKQNCSVKNDPLILEILLYIIDMFNFLTKFNQLHEKLNNSEVIAHLIRMLEQHENKFIMKSLTATLLEASKITAFYPDLLSDSSLSIFLNKMLTYQGESDSLNNMLDCLRNIIQQTKTPIKYILATSILKITEDGSMHWQDMHENNIYCLLKVLNYNIRFLNDEDEDAREMAEARMMSDAAAGASGAAHDASNLAEIPIKTTSDKMPSVELLQELQQKALKYSIMAITNILIQTEKDLILYKKLSILSILQENCKFEVDPQMNLRLLYLLNISLGKQHQRAKMKQRKDQRPQMKVDEDDGDRKEDDGGVAGDQDMNKPKEINQQSKEIQSQATVSLVNFLLENIFKFKGIIQFTDAHKESFAVDIPKLDMTQDALGNTQPANKSALIEGSVASGHSPSNDGLQIEESSARQQPVKRCTFFFEEEHYQLNKMSGIRLSLCLSLRILYILSVQKKKIACQAIADNKMSSDLFQFFVPYIEHKDHSGLKQIKQVVKIIQHCVEFQQLHGAILERESVTSLIRLAEAAIRDDFSDVDAKYRTPAYIARARERRALGIVPSYMETRGHEIQSTNETQRKIIIPILRIFLSLSQTDQFHWHLGQFNAQDLFNRIREKDDAVISEVAQDFSKNFLDHSNQGQLNPSMSAAKASMPMSSQLGLRGQGTQDAAALVADFNLANEVASLASEDSLPRATSCVLNIEKMLIQKKVKLDTIADEDLQLLIDHLERTLKVYANDQRKQKHGNMSVEDEQMLHLRRLQIRSLLVSFNFIYTKKYLKDVVDMFSQPISVDLKAQKTDIFGRRARVNTPSNPMETPQTIKLLREELLGIIREAKTILSGNQVKAVMTQVGALSAQATAGKGSPGKVNKAPNAATLSSLEGFTSFADFRDVSEELLFLFSSYAMSSSFTDDVLCNQVLPTGQMILQQTISAIKRCQESAQATSSNAGRQANAAPEDAIADLGALPGSAPVNSITSICSFQSVNSVLESVIIILRNPERNINIMRNYDMAALVLSILQIVKMFDHDAQNDSNVKDQFDSKIGSLSQNLELVTKLMYFSPQPLMNSSIPLAHNMLSYYRFVKTGIFAVYCTALMLQDPATQEDCLVNLIPVFSDERILSALFSSIRAVDHKHKDLLHAQSQATLGASQRAGDILAGYEKQTKAGAGLDNKHLKMEADARRELDEAVSIRKNCLQVLIVIVELLSSVVIQNDRVVLELKEREVKVSAQGAKKTSQQVVTTNIPAKQYERLVQLIYGEHDLLDLIYTHILMRVPGKSVMKDNDGAAHGKAHGHHYQPEAEEIKLGARAFASMPFMILKRKNPVLYVEQKYLDSLFSITGHFTAIGKVIDYGYSNGANDVQAPPTGNSSLTRELESKIQSDKVLAKKAAYFALFTLLDFVISVPLTLTTVSVPVGRDGSSLLPRDAKQRNDASLKLDGMNYGHLMNCLIDTGLLCKIIQLPQLVDVSQPEDETLVRLCMKLLICIIFKGQQASGQPLYQFTSDVNAAQSYQSIFEQSGIQDQGEVHKIMSQFQELVRKLHNFEIGQIYQESYVQYLHLLSQVTVNCSQLQQAGDPLSFSYGNAEFLMENFKRISETCVREDQRKKLLNADLQGQRTMLYQFFFINYLLSVSSVSVIRQAHVNAMTAPTPGMKEQRSIAQRIYTILVKLLEALGDSNLNQNLDESILERIQMFDKVHEKLRADQAEREGQPDVKGARRAGVPPAAKKGRQTNAKSSATMTIVKMILFNMEKLFVVSQEVQQKYLASVGREAANEGASDPALQHKIQLLEVDEDQLQLLVKLLTAHETHGEIVTKVYSILGSLLDACSSCTACAGNIRVLDNSKGLLQMAIKHSSIYQCEGAFKFLRGLVRLSDKYQNKADIEASLAKIMPASMLSLGSEPVSPVNAAAAHDEDAQDGDGVQGSR